MTLGEAIEKIDRLKPNNYTTNEKIDWLSTMDGFVKHVIIDEREGWQDVTYTGYTPDTPMTTKLLVPDPYDEIYFFWLEAQIDYVNREYNGYNNAILKYNELFQEYQRIYNAKHMHRDCGKVRFF